MLEVATDQRQLKLPVDDNYFYRFSKEMIKQVKQQKKERKKGRPKKGYITIDYMCIQKDRLRKERRLH